MERSLTKNKDVDKLILSNLDDKSLLNFCKIKNQYVQVLCQDENFWINRINSKYPYLKEHKLQNQTWRQFFIRMTYYIAKLEEEFGIPYIPAKGYDPEWFYIQWKNNDDIYNEALFYAAKAGNIRIVELLMAKIDEDDIDINTAMARAAEGGQIEMVKFLMDQGADDFEFALNSAASEGQIEMAKFLLEKGNIDVADIEEAMSEAAEGGQLEMIKYLIDQGARDFEIAIESADLGGHPEIVEYLRSLRR